MHKKVPPVSSLAAHTRMSTQMALVCTFSLKVLTPAPGLVSSRSRVSEVEWTLFHNIQIMIVRTFTKFRCQRYLLSSTRPLSSTFLTYRWISLIKTGARSGWDSSSSRNSDISTRCSVSEKDL